MAISTKFSLDAVKTPGIVHAERLDPESARKASELLTENHEKHYIFFDKKIGFHNHISHHLFSIFALGAEPAQLQAAYDENTNYQLPLVGTAANNSSLSMRDVTNFDKHLGDYAFYHDYLMFFQEEIEARSVPEVLNEYIFAGTERAEPLFANLFEGVLHPIIHLGYGIEFNQPAMVAEALAEIAVQRPGMRETLFAAEKAARKSGSSSETTILEHLNAVRMDEIVSKATTWEDPGLKLLSGLIPRAKDELVGHLSKYTVEPKDLDRKTAESIHMALWLVATPQKSDKEPAFDFFLMHAANASIWHSVFLKQAWIAEEVKCRLLEWKVRMDLSLFAAASAPEFYPKQISTYQPKQPDDWQSLFTRAIDYQDDGHTSKLIRAAKHAEDISEPYFGSSGFPLPKDAFLKIGHQVMDSVERLNDPAYGSEAILEKRKESNEALAFPTVVSIISLRWLQWAGFDEAWEDVPSRIVT